MATALAIAVLETRYYKSKEKWELLAAKAVQYLQKQLLRIGDKQQGTNSVV